jgi:carbamoyltransferase
MRILGLSAHYHDAAAALLVDGVPVAAVQQERLSRRKNDAEFPLAAIEWCLDAAQIEPGDLDAVVFYEKPMLKFVRILTSLLRAFPRSRQAFVHAMRNALGEKIWIKGIIASQLGISGKKVLFTEHHQAHAAAAFFPMPTDRAAILTADGVGEWATLTVGRGERGRGAGGGGNGDANGGGGAGGGGLAKLEMLREVRYPHSLGMLYSTFTAYLGFPVNEGEFKVMGLASYGKPRFIDDVRKVIARTADGAFSLDLRYFEFHANARRSFSDSFVELFGPARDPLDPIELGTADGARFADIAASVQAVLEEVLVDLARDLQRETGLRDLCLGGGVALNGCANARLLAESGFERVFVPPAPGDAGCALGAALYADRIHFRQPDRIIPDHPFWGPRVDPNELSAIAGEDGLVFHRTPDDASLLARVADALADGRVVGWMDGASELGPRALGNRSILAAPHDRAMRDRLNRRIKRREEFRPFAPAVPVEVAERYFELSPGGIRLGRFMSGVFPVRPEWRARLAAVTHVDGTARVQTVDPEMSPRFHALLHAYGARTGVPVLLNTSFNLAGEPIVNRAVEGYSTFRRSDIDLLVVGDGILSKEKEKEKEKERTKRPVAPPQEEVA